MLLEHFTIDTCVRELERAATAAGVSPKDWGSTYHSSSVIRILCYNEAVEFMKTQKAKDIIDKHHYYIAVFKTKVEQHGFINNTTEPKFVTTGAISLEHKTNKEELIGWNKPKELYHVTNIDNLKSIKINGLIPSDSTRPDKHNYKNRIHLATSLEAAKRIAKSFHKETPEKQFALLKINLKYVGALYKDMEFRQGGVYVDQPIPPKAIKVISENIKDDYSDLFEHRITESNNPWPTKTAKEWNDFLKPAGPVTSGLKVRNQIDNMGSIRSSFRDYFVLNGVREVPMSIFRLGNTKPDQRILDLIEQIQTSKEITPLIVAIDSWNGPYILEGAHRIDALAHMGIETFPALIVFDDDDNHWDDMWDDNHRSIQIDNRF